MMLKLRNWIALGLSALLAAFAPARAREPLLSSIFFDHAVLQRGAPIHVWGHAMPGAKVSVSLAGNSASAVADARGRWSADLPAMAEGGPYVLEAKAGWRLRARARDILIGDVFLCAGQSNMVLQVKRTLDSRSEIENATNDRIRMLTIANAANAVPQGVLPEPAEWQVASPRTVPEFSAACFYFARELQKKVNVPMGLVNAAWGGARIETWMSEKAIRSVGGYGPALDIIDAYARDPAAGAARFGEVWQAWWKRANPDVIGSAPWEANASGEWRAVPSVGAWDYWGNPALVDYTGTVWYRAHVALTAKQAVQGAKLSIGEVDEVDQTWVNGISVGGGSGGNRTYDVPAGLLHEGDNVVAVNILNTYKLGGLIGPAAAQKLAFKDGSSVALGNWQYRMDVPAARGSPPRAPWEPIAGLGMAYNAMIAPLGDYRFRGALWYQGESSIDQGRAYRALLEGLMADWRRQLGERLPFLIVQLPGFGAPPTKPEESGWAELREAQSAAAAADPNAALVVTIDIGERYDAHPANKQELGRRIARAARHLIYGENIVPTGPTAKAAHRRGDTVVIGFDDVEGGLVAYGSDEPIGFELCGDATGSCRYARAHISGNEIVLSGANDARRVRFAWANDPICNLFDKAGLPAAPFELFIK